MTNPIGRAALALLVIGVGVWLVVGRATVERWFRSVAIDMSTPQYRVAYVLGGSIFVALGVVALVSVFVH
jgi:hypothetical protein